MLKIDKRQMERMMRQMGIKTKELEGVKEVIIKMEEKEILLQEPQVVLTEMGGQRSYQITGKEIERNLQMSPPEEDVKIVMEQTGIDRESALKAIVETSGDLAEAIVKLKRAASTSGG